MRWFRRKHETPPIDEPTAYRHSYGERLAEVRPVKLPPRRPRFPVLSSGEDLRRRFEERLKEREDEEEQA